MTTPYAMTSELCDDRRRAMARTIRASGPKTVRELRVLLGGVPASSVGRLLAHPWFAPTGDRRRSRTRGRPITAPTHGITEAAEEAFR